MAFNLLSLLGLGGPGGPGSNIPLTREGVDPISGQSMPGMPMGTQGTAGGGGKRWGPFQLDEGVPLHQQLMGNPLFMGGLMSLAGNNRKTYGQSFASGANQATQYSQMLQARAERAKDRVIKERRLEMDEGRYGRETRAFGRKQQRLDEMREAAANLRADHPLKEQAMADPETYMPIIAQAQARAPAKPSNLDVGIKAYMEKNPDATPWEAYTAVQDASRKQTLIQAGPMGAEVGTIRSGKDIDPSLEDLPHQWTKSGWKLLQDKPGTGEAKGTVLYSEALEANKNIAELSAQFDGEENLRPGKGDVFMTALAGMLPDSMGDFIVDSPWIRGGPGEKNYDTNVNRFVNSVIRQQSGAAVHPWEKKDIQNIYFPTWGEDSGDIINAKAEMREQLTQAMRAGTDSKTLERIVDSHLGEMDRLDSMKSGAAKSRSSKAIDDAFNVMSQPGGG